MKSLVIALATTAALGLAAPAAASDWFVRVGATQVSPKSNNGDLAGGALNARINDNVQLGLTLGRHLSPNLAVEVLGATPFSHYARLNGDRAVGFKHLPPTVSLQWYFSPESRVNPFVGAGLNYTFIYDEKPRGPLAGTKVSIENSFGLAAQAGLLFRVSDKMDLVLDARHIKIDADVKVNGGSVGKVTVDPMVYSLMLGWRF